MNAGTHPLLSCKICLLCRICPVQVLRLEDNKIGDAGLSSFAEAVSKGGLASLGTLIVDNPEHSALKAACEARGIEL